MNKINNIEKVRELFKENKLTLLNEEFVSAKEKLTCVDEEGYKLFVSENQLQSGRMPERYNKFNPYTLENVQHMLDLESCGSKVITKEYKNSRMDLTITCESCGKEITKKWAQILNRKNFKCECCNSKLKRKSLYDVNLEFRNHGYKILEKEYQGNSVPMLCEDANGYKVRISYSNLISCGRTPSIFSPIYNSDNFIYNINHYFSLSDIECKALYYLEDEMLCDSNVVVCQCSCGREFKTSWPSILDNKVRCSYCSKTMSKLEYKVRKWLDENDIDYVFQKVFPDCKDKRVLPFDFYIPKFNCCIEVDGQQHFIASKFSNNSDPEKDLKIRKKHDKIKDDYCATHNIDLLRIDYNDIRRKNNGYQIILSNKFVKA